MKSEFDFKGHIVNLEDAQKVELPENNETYTDSELEQAGLVKTSAFIRTNKSKNALRIEKHKQKKATEGIKQLNVEVNEEYRDTIKQIAKQLVNGGKVSEELLQSLPISKKAEKKEAQNKQQSNENEKDDESVKVIKRCSYLLSQGGFKAWLIKKL